MSVGVRPGEGRATVRYRPSRLRRTLFGPPLELAVTGSHLRVGPAQVPLARVLYSDLVERPPHGVYAAANGSAALLFLHALIRGTMTSPSALFGAACSILAAAVWMLSQASLQVRLYADNGPPFSPIRGLSLEHLDTRRGPRLHASYRVWGRPPALRVFARDRGRAPRGPP